MWETLRNSFLAFIALMAPPDSDQAPVISISPMPPKQGQSATIAYTGKPGTILLLDWHPSGSPASVTIGANGSATIRIPTGATSLVVTDPTPNGAAQIATVIQP